MGARQTHGKSVRGICFNWGDSDTREEISDDTIEWLRIWNVYLMIAWKAGFYEDFRQGD
jgi:hypothetical protein